MPSTKKIYTFTKGINTAVANTKLPDDELEIIENWRLGVEGYDGVLLKRTGYDRKNANQHGSASKSIQSIYEYINDSSSYLLANNSNVGSSKLEYLTDYSSGSWTNISTDTAERARLRFATIKDKLYIANRSVGSTMYSNKFWDGTNYVDMGCPPPPGISMNMTASTVTGGLLANNSNYWYAVTFLYDGHQESSILGSKSGSTGATDNIITITTIPTAPQNGVSNGRITARKLYRTKAGGGTFYYLATIQNNTDTTYVDNTPDTALSDSIDIDMTVSIKLPYQSKYITTHKQTTSVLAYLVDTNYDAVAGASITFTPSDSGGSLGSGIYKYRFYLANYIQLTSSTGYYILNRPYEKTVDLSGLTGTDNKITIDWSALSIPLSFNRIFIERTSSGGGDFLTVASYASFGTGSIVDTTADTSRYSLSPNNFTITKVEDSNTSFPNFIAISDAGKPDLFSNIETQPDGTLVPSSNLFSVGEAITGIHSEEDRLIIFTGRAIYELDTIAKSRLFWKTNKLIDGVGSQAGLQCQTPEGYFFIPETVTNELSRICLFNANRVIDVGKPISKYMSNNSISTFLDIKYYQQLNEVWLLAETAGGITFIFKYRIDANEWTVDVNGSDLNFNCLGYTLNNGIMVGSNDGYIHSQTLGVHQDKIAGSLTSYTTKAKTKHFNLPDGDLNPSKFLATLQTSGGSTSTATIRYAVEDGTEYTTTLNNDQSGTTNLADGTHRLRTKSFNSNVTNNGKRDIYFQLETTNAKFEVLKDMTIELEERNQAVGGK